MRPARILVLRGGALGDFIVTLPALSALRKRWPDAHIELIGYPHIAGLAVAAGIINHVRSLNDGTLARYFAPDAPIRDDEQRYFASFDFIINYLHDPDGALASNLKRCGVQVLLTASPMVKDVHAVDHFLKPLESLAIYEPDRTPMMALPEKKAHTPSSIAIHPGSGSRNKNWPIDRFVEIAQRLTEAGHHVHFLTGDAEREYIDDVDKQLASFSRHHQLPLVDVANHLAHATAYIGNDSGISHLAAATGSPSLVLFGPSDARLWAPRGRHVKILPSPTPAISTLETEHVWPEIIALLGS